MLFGIYNPEPKIKRILILMIGDKGLWDCKSPYLDSEMQIPNSVVPFMLLGIYNPQPKIKRILILMLVIRFWGLEIPISGFGIANPE
jgi:hypothetical protein